MLRRKISKRRKLAEIEVQEEIDRQAKLKKRSMRQLRRLPGAMPTTQGGA